MGTGNVKKVRDVRRKLRMLVAVVATAAVAGPLGYAAPAEAASATRLQSVKLPGGGMAFDNYDYNKEKIRSNDKVDWAVNLLWTNNATVNKTSAGWSSFNKDWTRGSAMNAWVNGGWDSSKGLKQYDNKGCKRRASNYHYRTYAPPSTDYFTSNKYGHFVIGTAHDDFAEGCGNAKGESYGRQEQAEAYVADIWKINGSTVYKNKIDLKNAQTGNDHTGGQIHNWNNNGKATQIVVK
ncbi:hypothetical protein [Couchioplanes azureus]|uniref:hypothetical protein n=1 Tax=Couchioplanes caeruleus TaxID=56438 RepID=UPI00166F863D|nr:hypothetical protein [Couchioplanes caeruleus]GGQ87194.1 hypothetical protein GCM10010166_66640 [Couchioplanes caeruleus subsp. azureus]